MENSFSIKEAFSWGWGTFKQKWAFIIGAGLLAMIIPAVVYFVLAMIFGIGGSIIFGALAPETGEASANSTTAALITVTVIMFLVMIVVFLIQALMSIGLIKIGLKFKDGEKPELEDLFTHIRHLGRYFFGSITSAIAMFWPFLLMSLMSALFLSGASAESAEADPAFIIISLISALISVFFVATFFFWNYSVVDKSLGPISALKYSASITKGSKFKILLLLIVVLLFNLAGAIALLVGLFITIPVSWLVITHVYRQLAPVEQAVAFENEIAPQELQSVQQ